MRRDLKPRKTPSPPHCFPSLPSLPSFSKKMSLQKADACWNQVSSIINGYLTANRLGSPPPKPLNFFEDIRRNLDTQVGMKCKSHLSKVLQLQKDTQEHLMAALDDDTPGGGGGGGGSKTEKLQRARELEARAQQVAREFEEEIQPVTAKYHQKAIEVIDEWDKFLRDKDPYSPILPLLRSIWEALAEPHPAQTTTAAAAAAAAAGVAPLGDNRQPSVAEDGKGEVVLYTKEFRQYDNEEAFRLMSAGKMPFPFKRSYIGDVRSMFRELVAYTPSTSSDPYQPQNIRFQSTLFPFLFEGRYLLVVSQDTDYEVMDVISDYFQEEQRMRAKRADQHKSPWEFWHDKEFTKGLLTTLLRRGEAITTYTMREEFYRSVKECTQFKPSLVVSMIKLLRGTRMLDFSAGWGDRLIGAMAAGIERYVAVDPNLDLKPGHDAMIRAFAPASPGKPAPGLSPEERFSVIYSPFQTAVIPDGATFDLVFTSPPFFDFEIYTHTNGQSCKDFPGFEEWMVHFLYVSLEKAWGVLDVGGHMAIHITDIMKTRVCEPMNLFIQMRLPGARYAGLISSSGKAERPRPIWVWQKTRAQEADQARVTEAEKDLQKFFPAIFAKLGKKRRHED